LSAPSLPFVPTGWASRSSRDPIPASILELSEVSSLGLVLSYRVLRAHSGRFADPAFRRGHRFAAPPMRFAPLQRFPARGSSMTNRACLTRLTCVPRFSRPLDAFIRPVPAGLVSCRIRSWGCTLQSLAPLAQPYAVSSAVPLLSLAASVFLLPARTEALASGTGPVGHLAFRGLLHARVRHRTPAV